jgi:PPOX class probable F420-dependent enzyme
VGVPIDRVKPKASWRLQREHNLEADPRATLLAEHWNRDDWSRLWWVRLDGVARVLTGDARPGHAVELLRGRYPQYRETPPAGPLIEVAIHTWRGWAAGAHS